MASEFIGRSTRGIAVAFLCVTLPMLTACATNKASVMGTDSVLTGSIGIPQAPAPTVSGNSLTLASVLSHTMANNPDIGIARAQGKDAKAGKAIAATPYLPTVEYSAAIGPEHTFAYDTEIETDAKREEASIRASQLLFDFGKTSTDIERADALEQSAGLRLQAKTTEISMQTIEAYLKVLELDMQLSVGNQNIAEHQEMHRIVSLNEQGGNGTMADVQQALTRLQAAQQNVLDIQAARRSAASVFERITGLSPDGLRMPSAPAARGSISPSSIAAVVASDPLLLSLKQDKLSLEAQKQSLALGYLPQVTLDGTAKIQMNVGGNSPARTDARVMVSLNGTLFDGGDRIAKMEQIDARIEETDYRYRRAVDNLEYDLDDAQRILQTADAQLAGIAAQIQSGESVVSLYSQQFQAGTKGIFELLDAQQSLANARGEQITMQFDLLRAKYRILQLTGEIGRAIEG